MKNILQSIKLTAAMILAVAAFTSIVTNLSAAEPGSAKGGAALLLPSQTSQITPDAAGAKPVGATNMTCPKCKDATVKHVTVEKGHIEHAVLTTQHQCPGCGSTVSQVGHGKMKQVEWKHTCAECGDQLASCCVGAQAPGTMK